MGWAGWLGVGVKKEKLELVFHILMFVAAVGRTLRRSSLLGFGLTEREGKKGRKKIKFLFFKQC